MIFLAEKNYSFLKGALLLTVAGAISRFIGAISRIVLPRVIGPEAVGLLQMVYPVYSIFLIIAISGIPVAISKLIAEQLALGNRAGAQRIFQVASRFLFGAGLVSAVALFWLAPFIAVRIIGDAGTILPLRVLSPAVVLIALSSSLRGYFQGVQQMRFSAIAQVLEQVVRVIVIVALAFLLQGQSVELAASGAALGTVLGGGIGLFILMTAYLTKGRAYTRSGSRQLRRIAKKMAGTEVIKNIYRLALPIVFGALIYPISQSFDALIIPRQLQSIGYTQELARSLYGQLTGMAMALVHFPCVLTLGLGMALIPAVSESLAKREWRLLHDRIDNSLWLSMAVGLPASVGLFVLAQPISTLLFKIPEVAVPLKAVAFSTVCIALVETAVAILQGLGRVVDPVCYLVIGALIKAVLTYSLTGIPQLGIKGAGLAAVVAVAIPALLNFKALHKHIGYVPRLTQLVVKPVIASALMGLVTYQLYPVLEAYSYYLFARINLIFTVSCAVVTALVVYVLTLVSIGGIPKRFYYLLLAARDRITRL